MARDFFEWCEGVSKAAIPQGAINPPADPNTTEKQRKAEFLRQIINNIEQGNTINLNIGGGSSSKWEELSIKPTSIGKNMGFISHISISGINTIILHNLHISYINISGGHNCKLILINSRVRKIDINQGLTFNIESKESWLGNLQVQKHSVASLHVSGGGVLGFECAPPHADNPFTGSVSFKNVYLPSRQVRSYLSGAQTYTNLRAHLNRLENVQAANLIRAHEQDLELETDTFFNRFLGRLYSWTSRYGTSTWRPFAWFILLLSASFLVVLLSDGAVPGEIGGSAQGWRADLSGDRLVSSAVLALKSVIGPLLFVDSKAAVVPSEPWLLFLLFLLGLAEAALLFLFFLALRRRFRMQT